MSNVSHARVRLFFFAMVICITFVGFEAIVHSMALSRRARISDPIGAVLRVLGY